jgi:hypothetical protein
MDLSSSSQNTGSSNGFNLLFSDLTEKLGLDNHGLDGQESLSEDFEVSSLGDINDGDSVLAVSIELPGLLSEEGPDLIDIDGGEVESVALEVEDSDTLLTEKAGMVSVHGSPVVLQATSITATS